MADNDHRGRLRFRGDWGGANLTRAAGWLAQWVYDHTDDRRLSVIETGRGMGDNLRAVAAGEVDVAFATPASFARLALDGRGPFAGSPLTNLRAIAALPHRDAMLPVVRGDLGIATLKEIVDHPGPLRVSLGSDDADGFMGLGGAIVLEAAGIDLDAITARGGTVTRHEQPFDVIADLHEGRADFIVSEAIMTPDWQELAQGGARILSLTPAEATAIAERWSLETITIPSDYFPLHGEEIVGLNYSDWIVATTEDLADNVAELLARAFVENAEAFARSYRHLPVDYSPLRYPIDYRIAQRTPLELHPTAAQVYAAAATVHTEE